MFFSDNKSQGTKKNSAHPLVFLIALLLFCFSWAYASLARADGNIAQYENSIFTNKGQSTVREFAKKLAPASQALKQVKNLTVYVGYHGDSDGDWCREFDSKEKDDVANLAESFPDAELVWVQGGDMSAGDIKTAVKKGSAFFTWCDSDARVNKVMGNDMPAFVTDF